jgi:hypothetical protein
MGFQKQADIPKDKAKVLTPEEAEDYKRNSAQNDSTKQPEK